MENLDRAVGRAIHQVENVVGWVGVVALHCELTDGYCASLVLSSRMAAQERYESFPCHGPVVQFYIRWLIGKS